MSDALLGSRAKLQLAHERTAELMRKQQAFFNTLPVPHVTYCHREKGDTECALYVKLETPLPAQFSVLAGEIIGHLNSSLDLLFCALVRKNGRAVTERHSFPVFMRKLKFLSAVNRGLLCDVSQSAAERIDRLQPFHVATPDDTILAAVRELANTDKHRELISVCVIPSEGSCVTLGSADERNSPTIVGFGKPPPRVRMNADPCEYFRVVFAKPAPGFTMTGDATLDLSFAKCGRAENIPLVDTLSKLTLGIEHTVDEFAYEFR